METMASKVVENYNFTMERVTFFSKTDQQVHGK